MPGLQGAEGCQLADVRTGDKRFLAGPREDQHPDALIGGHIVERLGKFGQKRLVQGVQRFGPVERDGGDTRVDLKDDVFKRHGFLPTI